MATDLHHHEIVIMNVPFYQHIAMWDVDQIPTVLEAGQKKEEILAATESSWAKQEENDGR